ncbi:CAP domain-containing protein [Tropicimonas sp. S265A]|uniref:CAP domain-containing protein n=1 Tax=Tropicimonas sp. S265A TaxID=3415134 RepID=UPI003C7B7BF1
MIRQGLSLLAVLATLGACTVPPGPPTTASQGVPAPGLLAEVNGARAARGLPPLPQAGALDQAAATHAQDMSSKGYFAHEAPDGSTPLRRMRAAGFDACYAAETIARGQRTEAAVVEGWINSPEHAALMFSRNPTAAGTGRAGTYWVMTLARPC